MPIDAPAAGVDPRAFRQVVGHLASGVTVITTASEGRDMGMTASSVTSLSADPPMMLACLNNDVPTAAAVAERGAYVVNVLGEQQGEVAMRFAAPSPDKFAGCDITRGALDLPVLSEAIAHLECRVVDSVSFGTHTIHIGEVVTATTQGGRPLTYFQGGFGRFEFAHNDEIYGRIRDLILHQHVQPNDALDVAQMADQLGTEEAGVFYAFTRLTSEGLLTRHPERGYLVRPFDERISHEAFDARLMLEREALGLARREQRETARAWPALRRALDVMGSSIHEDRFTDFPRYVEANLEFHREIVRAGESATALNLYESLNLRAVLLRSFGPIDETSMRYVTVQRRVLEAVEAGHYRTAIDLLAEYSALAKERVSEVLRRAGGVI